MKLRTISLIATLVILSGMFLVGPQCGPSVEEKEKAHRVMDAISDLDSMDYVVVRGAIRELVKVMDAPNIFMAVPPLKKVLSNTEGFHDAHTRGMAALALVKIGVYLEEPRGNVAIKAVIQELEEGKTESVRATSAYALGISGWDSAWEPLVVANQRDKSPIVREAACSGLLLLSDGTYQTATCKYEDEDDIPSTMFSANSVRNSTSSAPTEDINDVDLRWLQTHLFMPLDSFLELGEQKTGASE